MFVVIIYYQHIVYVETIGAIFRAEMHFAVSLYIYLAAILDVMTDFRLSD